MVEIEQLDIRKVLEHAHIGIVIHRADTSIVYANPAALKLLKLGYEQMIGKDAFDPSWTFVNEQGLPLDVEEYPVNRVLSSSGRIENEILGILDKQGQCLNWFMVNGYMEGRPNTPNRFVVITFSDITESIKPFSAEDILENATDMIIVTEAEDIDYPEGPRIVYVNKAFEQQTGYTKEEVIGETPRILQGSLTDKNVKAEIREALKCRKSISKTLLNYDKSGRPYWIQMNIIPLKSKNGTVTHFAAIERDISQIKFQQEQLENRNNDLKALKYSLEKKVKERARSLRAANEKLQKMAYFDPLTQLPNRRLFSVQLNKLIKSASRRSEKIAFGLLDIDDFKKVNDLHGHLAGDHVLKSIAQAMNNTFRLEDSLCRYGGEEFVFAFCVSEYSQAKTVGDRLIEDVSNTPVEFCENKIFVTVSIGIVVSDTLKDLQEQNLYNSADRLMYLSKRAGKNRATCEILAGD
ncbi:sensor domain-containing diguanylate cyclase [Alteromonas antoniana]|uniref:sensor domain-containing diguanylate cyclase n=1 Tax=Alteromonas antoniana TaxID=2803813 RepID=UPI001C458AF9|nr:sensor domain-containing diguanylate cyclase [Alteromonas antoniana]